jgi:opacity protein-like surface antigen
LVFREFETGLIANSVDRITGTWATDADLYSVPLMLNAKFRVPNRSLITPYGGVGVGGLSTVLDIDRIGYGDTWFSGSASDVVFAWQAFAGFRVALNENMGLGLEYRYMRAEGPAFEADYGWGWYQSTFSDELKFDDLEIQSVSIRFDVMF